MLSIRCARSAAPSGSSSTSACLLRSPPSCSTRPFHSSPSSSAESDPYLNHFQRKVAKTMRNFDPDDASVRPTGQKTRTHSLAVDMPVWPPPASYRKKGIRGLPGKNTVKSFTRPTHSASDPLPEAPPPRKPLSRPDSEGWQEAHAPGSEPWDPKDDGFKKLRFFKGGVSGGVPKWIQKKKDALDTEHYDTSTPNPRHGRRASQDERPAFGLGGASSPGEVYSPAKKPRSALGRHAQRSVGATTDQDYESPRSLSMHLMKNCSAGLFTVEDAHEKVLNAPGDLGHNAPVWNTLMTLALKQRRWSKAIGFYNEMKRRNIKPSDRTFSILLSNLPVTLPASQQSLSIAASLYTTITTLSNSNPHEFPPSPYALNSYLSFLAKSKRYDIMERVWEDLPPRGPLAPDTLAWTAMFNGLVKRDDDVPKAIEDGKRLWSGLVGSVLARTGLKVDTRLLAMVMRLFTRAEEKEDKELALRIATAYVQLPENVSNSLKRALDESEAGRNPKEKRIVVPSVAEEAKFPAEEHTIETLMNLLLSLDRPAEVIKLYRHFSDKSQPIEVRSKLTTSHLNRALAACVVLPDSASAWQFLQSKNTPNAFPNLQSYQVALEACTAAVDWEMSVKLFKLITGVRMDIRVPGKIVVDQNFSGPANDTPQPPTISSPPDTSRDEFVPNSSLSDAEIAALPHAERPQVSISLKNQKFLPDCRMLSAFFVCALSASPQLPAVRESLRLATAFHTLTSFSLFDPHHADYRTNRPMMIETVSGKKIQPELSPLDVSERGERTRKTAHREFFQRKLARVWGKAMDVAMRRDEDKGPWGSKEARDWAFLKEGLRRKIEGSHLEHGRAEVGEEKEEGVGRQEVILEKGYEGRAQGEALGMRRRGKDAYPEGTSKGALSEGKGGLLWRE